MEEELRKEEAVLKGFREDDSAEKADLEVLRQKRDDLATQLEELLSNVDRGSKFTSTVRPLTFSCTIAFVTG